MHADGDWVWKSEEEASSDEGLLPFRLPVLVCMDNYFEGNT
jgi:hypothetical protein